MGRIFLREKNTWGMNIPGEMLHRWYLIELLYEILLNFPALSLPVFLVEIFQGNNPAAIFYAFSLPGNNFHGRGIPGMTENPVKD